MKRGKKKKGQSTAAERVPAGRGTPANDPCVLERLEAIDDLVGLVNEMAEADTLLADFKRLRKLLPAIDAVLAKDPDNLCLRLTKAERRRKWKEQERVLRDAARRSMVSSVPQVRSTSSHERVDVEDRRRRW